MFVPLHTRDDLNQKTFRYLWRFYSLLFRGFFVALFCLEKQCSGLFSLLFRGFFVAPILGKFYEYSPWNSLLTQFVPLVAQNWPGLSQSFSSPKSSSLSVFSCLILSSGHHNSASVHLKMCIFRGAKYLPPLWWATRRPQSQNQGRQPQIAESPATRALSARCA